MERMNVVAITGNDLDKLKELISEMAQSETLIYRMRVAIDSEGFKVAINNTTWTPGYGQVIKYE